MVIREFFAMKEAVSQYNSLQECILLSIKFSENLTSMEFSFNYIYDADGKLRLDMDREQILTFRFGLVQIFKMNGGLNTHQLLNPELVNWGLNEISKINILNNSELLKESANLNFYHFEILWESARRIDVIFSTMEIFESPKRLK